MDTVLENPGVRGPKPEAQLFGMGEGAIILEGWRPPCPLVPPRKLSRLSCWNRVKQSTERQDKKSRKSFLQIGEQKLRKANTDKWTVPEEEIGAIFLLWPPGAAVFVQAAVEHM